MTRAEADRIMIEIKDSVKNCINKTPLRRKGDELYVRGLLDLTLMTEQILKEHID